jgi:hypothetical protein
MSFMMIGKPDETWSITIQDAQGNPIVTMSGLNFNSALDILNAVRTAQ